MLVSALAPVTRHDANGSPCDATVKACCLSFVKPAVELISSSVADAITTNTTRLIVTLLTNCSARLTAAPRCAPRPYCHLRPSGSERAEQGLTSLLLRGRVRLGG